MAEQQIHILVVDDDHDTLEFMADLLVDAGYTPILSSEHEDAYPLARRLQPDLAILDLQMADPEAGWTILAVLRADPATAHIPAILYSSNHAYLHVRQEVLRKKRCAVLKKPFEIRELLDRIAETLAWRTEGALQEVPASQAVVP